MNTQEIVSKLWGMCNVLRDDGITYQDYVTELTYLLFLKMMQETDQESGLPEGYRWSDLVAKEGVEQLNYYREMLVHLGTEGKGPVQAIFNNANSSLKKPRNLLKLVTDIDALDWYSARSEGLGDLYEGLLEKNANEKKSGAGQYFTPRPLIESMVNVTKPQPGEVIQDPAAGTGGFLTHADRYMKAQSDDYFELSSAEQKFQKQKAFHAVEPVFVNIVAAFYYAASSRVSTSLSGFNVIESGRTQLRVDPLHRDGFADFASRYNSSRRASICISSPR